MNGRRKSFRLCLVFALAGSLTVMCLARTSISIPASVTHYLDIVMAVLMVVLLLCVLELCLGVELCAVSCCTPHHTTQDAEGRGGGSGPSTPEFGEAPPSYEVVMAQGGAGTHTGGGGAGAGRGGRARGRGREAEPLKLDFYVYFKRHAPEDDNNPPMRPSVSPGESETSFVSASELWLSVDGLPSYEEAVARLREEEVVVRLQEEVMAQVQEEEEEAMARLQEEVVEQPREEEVARLWEEAVARLQGEGTG